LNYIPYFYNRLYNILTFLALSPLLFLPNFRGL